MTCSAPSLAHRRYWRCLVALGFAGSASIAACSGDGPTAPDPCGGPFTLRVGEGPRPSFSWAPACQVYLLAVTDTTGRVVWQRIGAGNDITPPVRYPDAEPNPANGDATPLVPGRRYGVQLWRTVPRSTLCLGFLTVCGISVVTDTAFVR